MRGEQAQRLLHPPRAVSQPSEPSPRHVLAVVRNSCDAARLRPVLDQFARRGAWRAGLILASLDPALLGSSDVADLEIVAQFDPRSASASTSFAKALETIASVLRERCPRWLLVMGESNVSVAAAQAARLSGVPLAHLDAGSVEHLNSDNDPLPAGLVDACAQWCFATGVEARETLLARGVAPERIAVTGSTKIDALLNIRERVTYEPRLGFQPRVPAGFYSKLDYWDGKIVVAANDHAASACNAAASVGARWTDLLAAVCREHPSWLFVCTGRDVEVKPGAGPTNLLTHGALDHESFVWLLGHADLVLTRSLEVQEYAEVVGTPVIAVGGGPVRSKALACAAQADKLQSALELVLQDEDVYQNLISPRHAHEDGLAAERMVNCLLRTPTPLPASSSFAARALGA